MCVIERRIINASITIIWIQALHKLFITFLINDVHSLCARLWQYFSQQHIRANVYDIVCSSRYVKVFISNLFSWNEIMCFAVGKWQTNNKAFSLYPSLPTGIPVHAILFAFMGEFFGKTVSALLAGEIKSWKINFFHFYDDKSREREKWNICGWQTFPLQFVRLYNRYKNYKRSTNTNWVPPRLSFIGQVVLYLLPAMVVFIFFPAVLFTYFEGWDYTISAYYAFVTLTTIGKA